MLPRFTKPPLLVNGLAWYPYSDSIQKALTFESKYGDRVELFERSGDRIGVPRGLVSAESLFDQTTEGHPIDINCTVPPRNKEQARLIQQSVALLKNGKNHILRATTGIGKSFVGINVAAQLNCTTLIVVTKEDLMGEGQWRGAIKKFTDCTDDDIGVLQQDVCDYKGKKFVLGMVHSLVKDKYPDEVKRYFGLVIWDEVHRMGAETFSQSCGMFSSRWRLGLSATPKRIDAKDFIFKAHIGPVMVEADLVPLKLKAIMEKTKFRLPMVTRRINGNWVSVPLPHDGAKMMGVYKAMAQDQGRNALILDFVYAAWKKGRKIIVFSDLRDAHLEPMYHQCIARGIPAEDMAFYVGGLTEKQRELAKTKQILWATYKMTSEATDIPTLDTAVFATPRANITQPVGRILRSHPEKKQPIVFDLVDNCSSILQAYASKRRTEYYRLGGEVVTL